MIAAVLAVVVVVVATLPQEAALARERGRVKVGKSWVVVLAPALAQVALVASVWLWRGGHAMSLIALWVKSGVGWGPLVF